MKLTYFRDISFLQAIKALFNELNVPVNYVADEPTSAQEILKDTYKENSTFQLVNEVYFVGMIDDAAFEGNKSLAVEKIKSDYDGILIFGVSLNQRENNLLPTRSQLAEISRAFNREFYYTPVVLVFKYADDKGQYIAFANTERLQYKQAWREGEKAGKVSLLRDIDIQRPHRGHEDIINQLRIQTSGTKAVDTFAKLYAYWQEVFSVSVLNKRFYLELSNWYFWAVKQVTFPDKPTEADAIKKNAKLDDLIQEHNATNVIRLLTRLLFTWFIKEKKLIPEELFDLEALQKDILNDIAPYHENGLFNQANKDSVYYRAILQNLFFASLNCPIKPDGTDSRERGFRGDGYGTHRGIDYLMRYKRYFKNPDAFLELMNQTVPFLNGGLFECLDDKYSNTYIDGFSDQMTKGEQLIVPDYLFFGTPEEVDLSAEYGVNNNTAKKAAVKGLINILKSYKFTITENTPIEEDVALDPELLGKVFENLLASYNPETKTTARKQTGSFYTPREIVNYMVDESLIAYLKNAVTDWKMDEKQVDEKLHQLASFDSYNPFANNPKTTRLIVSSLDRCKILDPACGSGAFPMGVLQKMVHMLQKLDPNNIIWKEVQIQKVQEETSEVFKTIDDKAEREEKLKEINNAFDQRVNDPDYARKLYLIENCIYGVDIQPIATQISKLRFFISLVVDQKSNSKADVNFGIRPLPNLETKFVTANTLIGINKEANLFTTDKVKDLEKQLKHIRHKLFSARTKDTKLKYRQKDEELRKTIAEELKSHGLPVDSAEKLAKWDPYDQNSNSLFFDSEWMYDISEGFDIIIGNPPYIKEHTDRNAFEGLRDSKYYQGKMDIWYFFACVGIDMLKLSGHLCFIATNNWITNSGASKLRNKILENSKIKQFIDFSDFMIFESAGIQTMILLTEKCQNNESYHIRYSKLLNSNIKYDELKLFLGKTNHDDFLHFSKEIIKSSLYNKTFDFIHDSLEEIFNQIYSCKNFSLLSKEINSGIDIPQDFVNKSSLNLLGGSYNVGDGIFVLSQNELDELELDEKEKTLIKPFYTTKELYRYHVDSSNKFWIIYTDSSFKIPERMNSFPKLKKHLDKFQKVITSENKPYGLNRARDEKFFKGERLLVQRKCPYKPSFVFVDFDSYVNRTFIPLKTNRMDLKYLSGLFNSKLCSFWLKHKGKLQGDNFQVDKDPIMGIPINNDPKFSIISLLVSLCIKSKVQSELFENIIDALVLELYFSSHLKELEIDILQFVERDLEKVMQGKEFEKLSDTEKEQVIEQLHQTWSHPDSEVRNRIKLFAVRSPEILKPILES